MSTPSIRLNLVRKGNKMRFNKLDTLNLKEVEQEIDTLISIAGDDPSDETIKEVSSLIKVANALGTSRKW